MNIKEHLLVCLSEECSEIEQDIAKMLRFGIGDINILDPAGPTNVERLLVELNQLMAVVDMCIGQGIIPENWQDKDVQTKKREKVLEYMKYAFSKGTLSEITI